MATKEDLRNKIKRGLGYPLIKVELTDDQIDDAIDQSVEEFVEWAVGQATQETFFTIMLSGGQPYYDMPTGVVNVISVDSNGSSGGINTLFTLENYMYNQGLLETLVSGSTSPSMTLVDYHIALDFINTLRRYTPPEFNWKYHKRQNILEIQPVPKTGNTLQVGDYTFDSPGFVLVRSFMLNGSQLDGTSIDDIYEEYYSNRWVKEYAAALSKKTLGYVRRKFAQFQSMGNQGLYLDGDLLVSEANEELKELMEEVKKNDCWIGGEIIVG